MGKSRDWKTAPSDQAHAPKQQQAQTQLRFERMQRWNAPTCKRLEEHIGSDLGVQSENRSERLDTFQGLWAKAFLDQEAQNRQVQWSQQWPTSVVNGCHRELWELEEESFRWAIHPKNQREVALPRRPY